MLQGLKTVERVGLCILAIGPPILCEFVSFCTCFSGRDGIPTEMTTFYLFRTTIENPARVLGSATGSAFAALVVLAFG